MDNKFQLHTQINTNNKQFEGRINYPHRKTNKFNKEKTECKFKLILLKVDSYKECLHYIMHSLNNDNIEEYINDVKNSSNLPLEKQFNKYFYSIKLAEDIIINYQSKHLNKNTNKEIRTTQDKVSEHHKKMLEYIRQTKTELIKKLVDSNNKETRNKKSI